MKRAIISALVCLNLGLIAAVVFHARPQPAYSQRGRGAEYMMVTVGKTSNQDAVIVIDTSSRLMRGWFPNQSGSRVELIPLGPRDLSRDFPEEVRR